MTNQDVSVKEFGMSPTFKNEIYLVITDFTIHEANKTKFSTYMRFCEYIHKALINNQLDMVNDHIKLIVNGCNTFFGFGDEMYTHVFDFFIKRKFELHYKLVKMIHAVHGQYIKTRKIK